MPRPRKRTSSNEATEIKKLKRKLKQLELVAGAFAIIAIIAVVYALYGGAFSTLIYGAPAGLRLTGINQPLTPTQLSYINNAPDSYFQYAGEAILNLSLPNEQLVNGTYRGPVYVQRSNQYPAFVWQGKPSVIYVGATSCVYCGENRWAMALALSRFGKFDALYKGYSAFKDADVPTLYWGVENITNAGINFKNEFSSNSINFISGEYDSNITAGFQLPNSMLLAYIDAARASNLTMQAAAMEFMNSTGEFSGTPFTLWGTSLNLGADAVVFGTSKNASGSANYPPLTYMTHSDILDALHSFNSTFALEEYAAADVYAAQMCPSINNTASVCKLPAIIALEHTMGLG